MAVDDLLTSGTFEELLADTISQIKEFETQSCGAYTPDDYHIQNPAMNRSLYQDQKSPYVDFSRASRICHRTSSVGVLFGKIWVRTSTLRLAIKSGAAGGEFQITTSFIFYPSSWLTKIGLGHGVEASLKNSKGGWKFVFNPIRAVPDDSLIFELCRDGDWRGVERLLRRQEASLRDTSSQGWTPLHFAAEAGHVELCDMLLQSGADKRALAFKGPSKDALSPVTIFVATNHDLPAEHKIRMLRLFSDCLELTDPSGDGWTVHAELKRAYNREKVPIPENSTSWLLRATAAEEFIAFGPKTIWSALQSSVRSFLVHERNEQMLQRLLGLSQEEKEKVSGSHATSIAHWLALRASERELLPMVIDAGRLCNIAGFDWVEDELTPSQFVRTLPVIYHSWALAFPSNIDKVEKSISVELEAILERGKWGMEVFLASMSLEELQLNDNESTKVESRCSVCHDDYSSIGIGVVSPAWIAFLECTKTNHRHRCHCSLYLENSGVISSPPQYTHPSEYISPFPEDEESIDEDPASLDISKLCHDFIDSRSVLTKSYDPFTEAATILYRAQGRTWLNDYVAGEVYCATCFLLREGYIGESGLGTEGEFSEMPESFSMCRVGEGVYCFDKE
ncbi:hypothetical protein MFIFM68171_07283 [Madurella fahalii]|uniref:Ankyrin repeat protein n=1 Tax=Madurella fahalii TaxID=1157608 RepID=A0ABQ0GH36_9PEZI